MNCGVETCPVSDLPAELAGTLDHNKHQQDDHQVEQKDTAESYLDYFRQVPQCDLQDWVGSRFLSSHAVLRIRDVLSRIPDPVLRIFHPGSRG
jgi:hypothetical protein